MPRPLFWFSWLQAALAVILSAAIRFAPSYDFNKLSEIYWLTLLITQMTIIAAWSAFATCHWMLRLGALAILPPGFALAFGIATDALNLGELTFLNIVYVSSGLLAACPWRFAGYRWFHLDAPSELSPAKFQVSVSMLLGWTAISAEMIFVARLAEVSPTDWGIYFIVFFPCAALSMTALIASLYALRFPWKTCLLLPSNVALIGYAYLRYLEEESIEESIYTALFDNPFLYASLWLIVWIVALRKSGYRIRREQTNELASVPLVEQERGGNEPAS